MRRNTLLLMCLLIVATPTDGSSLRRKLIHTTVTPEKAHDGAEQAHHEKSTNAPEQKSGQRAGTFSDQFDAIVGTVLAKDGVVDEGETHEKALHVQGETHEKGVQQQHTAVAAATSTIHNHDGIVSHAGTKNSPEAEAKGKMGGFGLGVVAVGLLLIMAVGVWATLSLRRRVDRIDESRTPVVPPSTVIMGSEHEYVSTAL